MPNNTPLTENQLSKAILDAAFKVHTKTGPGLLETVYEVLSFFASFASFA